MGDKELKEFVGDDEFGESEYEGINIDDYILKSLFRNPQGYLCPSKSFARNRPVVPKDHNVAVLYFYVHRDSTIEGEDEISGDWALDGQGTHYHITTRTLFSYTPQTYLQWWAMVKAELKLVPKDEGCYGWSTSKLKVSKVRTGDVIIKIDENGCDYRVFDFTRPKDQLPLWKPKRVTYTKKNVPS